MHAMDFVRKLLIEEHKFRIIRSNHDAIAFIGCIAEKERQAGFIFDGACLLRFAVYLCPDTLDHKTMRRLDVLLRSTERDNAWTGTLVREAGDLYWAIPLFITEDSEAIQSLLKTVMHYMAIDLSRLDLVHAFAGSRSPLKQARQHIADLGMTDGRA